ncbi:hypothetical protein [Thermoflexus sp.]|uniref:hypothetical protein n=1 Tax=Thermoflexus sp. TaxID=1969742 RepID=UPI0025F1152E|nr:hypothetical protein [Thermoflexus sp.]MDW8180661.1 hypothetical protein [Anaerolineae bacterium]MCS6963996.1 hypothetical protein [Thermoflexus sp.]MCS7351207.1 hypothetical protein [Thermoflexus sp.]MCX7690952.1 hypothetical protein [Thermoflexus sp.]MDW8184132.1 hypothetical protein [Anaerolineae bacterium]
MSPAWAFRLILAAMMIALGLVIIGRSLWLVISQGLALSSLLLPVIVGILMMALGVRRWRSWIDLHRPDGS